MILNEVCKKNYSCAIVVDMSKKLRYFIARKRKYKSNGISYYWQFKSKALAEKYKVPYIQPLGKDYIKAVKLWRDIMKTYLQNKSKENEFGEYVEVPELIAIDGSIQHMTYLYYEDRRFKRLSARTQKDYKAYYKKINEELLLPQQKKPFGTMKISYVNREFVKKFYEQLLENKGKRTAALYINALSNLIKTAYDNGYYKEANPCSCLTMERNTPRNQVWSEEEYKTFCKTALELNYIGIYLATIIAYNTTQRLTDILKLKWSNFDNELKWLHILQSKTGASVDIPIYKMNDLHTELLKYKNTNEKVVIQPNGHQYDEEGYTFNKHFVAVKKVSGIREELWFRDLRRTAITRLETAGCVSGEISALSGHSHKTINDMLDVYSPATKDKAVKAIDKLNNSFDGGF